MKNSFSLKNLIGNFRRNVSLILLLILLVLLLCAGWVVRGSIAILIASQHIEVNPKTQSVRVNFKLYQSIADRFSQETSFTPTPVTAKDPFGLLDFETK